MEKSRTCKFCNEERRLKTLEFQASQQPKAHQSLEQPHNTTPSKCCACDCELKEGDNVSKAQMKKNSNDRRCNLCAEQHRLTNNLCGADAQVRRKLSSEEVKISIK